jgi:hypothetical protein
MPQRCLPAAAAAAAHRASRKCTDPTHHLTLAASANAGKREGNGRCKMQRPRARASSPRRPSLSSAQEPMPRRVWEYGEELGPHLPSPAPPPRAGACAAAQEVARRVLSLQGMRGARGEVAWPTGSRGAEQGPDGEQLGAEDPRPSSPARRDGGSGAAGLLPRRDARRSGCACGGAGLSRPPSSPSSTTAPG